jgi:tetratricopeptide (TPR) repeat protein
MNLRQSREPVPLIFLIPFLASAALYLNVLWNRFVIDDIYQISQNPWIRDITSIPEIFASGVWAFAGRESSYYRPVMHLIYMAAYHVFGLRPWGFHLVSILFHAGASVLVFLITSRLLKESELGDGRSYLPLSLTAALLFAAHPIHTEAVAWAAGIPDLSFSFFCLLSFYLYVRSKSGSKISIAASVISFFVATLCKEPALTLLMILPAYDYTFGNMGAGLLGTLRRYLPYLAAAAVYFVLRMNALGGFAPAKTPIELTLGQGLMNGFVLFAKYMEKLLIPLHLNVWHSFRPVTSLFSPRTILSLCAFIVFLCVGALAASRSKIMFLSLCLMAVPLLPSFYFPALTQGLENAFTERYLYFSSFGFILFIAGALAWIQWKWPKTKVALSVVILALIGFYSWVTVARNTVWKSSYTLWSDATQKSPESGIPHLNLGYALLYEGRPQEAKEHFRSALQLKPDVTDSFIDKGIAYSKKGLLDEAIFQFHAALILEPGSAAVHYNLGLAYDNAGWSNKAIEQYEIALKLKPDYPDAHNNLGIAYGKRGLIDKAIEHFQQAVQLNSNDPVALQNLANAYRLKGLPDKAEEYLQRARRLSKP